MLVYFGNNYFFGSKAYVCIKGYRVAVLSASPFDINIYRRLGFREYCMFSMYEGEPEDHYIDDDENWKNPIEAWSDLPETALEDLDRIRHTNPPGPPLKLQ